MRRKVHGTLGSVDRCSCQCALAVISSFCGSAEAAATKSPVCAILGNPHNLIVSFACFTLWYSFLSYSVLSSSKHMSSEPDYVIELGFIYSCWRCVQDPWFSLYLWQSFRSLSFKVLRGEMMSGGEYECQGQIFGTWWNATPLCIPTLHLIVLYFMDSSSCVIFEICCSKNYT